MTGRAPIMLSVTTKLILNSLIQCNKECRVPIKTMASTTAGVSSNARLHFPPLQRTAWINSTCKACTRPRLPVASVVVIMHSAAKGGHSLSKPCHINAAITYCYRKHEAWSACSSKHTYIHKCHIRIMPSTHPHNQRQGAQHPGAWGPTPRGGGCNTQRRRAQHGKLWAFLYFSLFFFAFLCFSSSLFFAVLFAFLFFLFAFGCCPVFCLFSLFFHWLLNWLISIFLSI